MLPKNIIIHQSESVTGATNRQFATINRLHGLAPNNFPKSSLGYTMGYHDFIEWDGTLIKARADTDIGAHTIGKNGDSLGVCLAGDFNQQMPTDAQIATLKKYLLEKMQTWKIPATNIKPHRYWATFSLRDGKFIKNTGQYTTWDNCLPYKNCPGSNVPDNWGQLLVAPPPSTVSTEEVNQAMGILQRLLTLLQNYLAQRKALGMPVHQRYEAE